MKHRKKHYFFLLGCLFVLFIANAYTNKLYAENKSSDKLKKRLVKLIVGQGDNQIKIIFDISQAKRTREKNRLILNNAIVDFSLPFNKIKSNLQRSTIGGKELINEINIMCNKNDNQTALLFRLTTKGIGGGKGKIGVSLVAAFNLDRNIFASNKGKGFLIPSNGKLTSSKGKLRIAPKYVKKDLAKVGAKSEIYLKLVSVRDSSSFFHGFVIFDPTNPKSINNAYFEFSSSESHKKWTIKKVYTQ